MPSVSHPTKLRCVVDGEDELVFYKIDIIDEFENIISTMEYADITEYFNDLLKIEEETNLYSSLSELKKDLAEAKLNRFLKKYEQNQRLEILMQLSAKLKHQNGECGELCIYCNPDLGPDPLPDFTFKIKNSNTEGSS